MKKYIVILTILCAISCMVGCKKGNEVSGKLIINIGVIPYPYISGATNVVLAFSLYETIPYGAIVDFELDWGTEKINVPPRKIRFSLSMDELKNILSYIVENIFDPKFNNAEIKLYYNKEIIWKKTITEGLTMGTTEYVGF